METWTPILHLQERLFNIIDASIPNKAQNSAIKGLVGQAVGDCMNQIAEGHMFRPHSQDKQTNGIEATVAIGPVTTEPLTIIP